MYVFFADVTLSVSTPDKLKNFWSNAPPTGLVKSVRLLDISQLIVVASMSVYTANSKKVVLCKP